jgi:hypothetical protein
MQLAGTYSHYDITFRPITTVTAITVYPLATPHFGQPIRWVPREPVHTRNMGQSAYIQEETPKAHDGKLLKSMGQYQQPGNPYTRNLLLIEPGTSI